MSGAKGGGGSFTQKPDTLRSNDTFEGLLGLCVGPIKGPVRGLKSIRVNGTPIEGDDNRLNFPNFTATIADGDPVQHPQIANLRLGAGGSPDQIGANIRNHPDAGGNPWVTHTLNNTGADAVDLRFVVQNLYRQTAKGIYEDKLTLEVQMKPTGTATWINPFDPNGQPAPAYNEKGYPDGKGFIGLIARKIYEENLERISSSTSTHRNLVIKGKTTSPYVHELRVRVPNEGVYANKGWDIRVRLLERESYDSPEGTEDKHRITERRLIQWESMTAVYDGVLGDHEDWRGLSWLQMYGKASDNFTGLPDIDGVYDTKIVRVPPASVYDPLTRLYSGTIWDGSWSKSFSRDPAWVINDAISDSLAGIAAFVPGASLNKWDALELSKWASELVPDGQGGMHPRYSMDIYVDQPQKADEFVQYLAGAVGAVAWDSGDGEWRLKVDKPEAPSNIFTHENIEGEFLYSHTDVDTRFNDVTVVFLNEEFDYREDRIRVQDFPDIERNGRKPTRVVAVGCTNRQQALRLAVLRLRTNLNEKRMVTFRTNRQGRYLERFDQILIADGSLDERNTTGRVVLKQSDGLAVTVRDPVRLELGAAYELHFTVPNPAYDPEPTSEPTDPTWNQPSVVIKRTVTNTAGQRGDVTTLYLDQAVPADLPENAVVALAATGLPTLPKTYRVVDVGYDEGESVTVNAMEVDTGKWAAADNADETALNISTPTLDVPAPIAPQDGMFQVREYSGEFDYKRYLSVNWQRPATLFLENYRLEYQFNDGAWIPLGTTLDTYYELVEPVEGSYRFRIYAQDRRGRSSAPLEGVATIDGTLNLVPVAELSNSAVTIPAAQDGAVASFEGAGGQFVVRTSLGAAATDVAYSVVSTTGGLSITIDPLTGAYTVTGLAADFGSAVLRAVYAGQTFELTYTIAKARAGVAGAPGNDGAPGANAKTGFLTNENHTVATASDGTGANFTGSGGTFKVFDGSVDVTTASTFTITGGADSGANHVKTQNGLTISVVKATGVYSLSGTWTSDTETFTIRANHNGTLIDKVYTISKAKGGATGAAAKTLTVVSDRQTIAYNKDGVATPTTQTTTFSTNKQNTTGTVTWSVTDANGVARTPVTSFLSAATGNSVTMTEAQFASARNGTSGVIVTGTITDGTTFSDTISIVRVQDGATGSTGSAGANSAVVEIYKRAAAAGSLPSAATTYTFASGVLTGLNNGWSTTYPAVDGTRNPVWVSVATASAVGATDTIDAVEWSTPIKMLGGVGNYDNLDWTTPDLWLGRPGAITDFDNGNIRATYVRDGTSGTTIAQRWPAEAGANITESRIASGFTGQTAWATFSAPTARLNRLSDTGEFSSLDFVTNRNLSQLNGRAWTNLFRANGTTAITDADAITSLGTAAGFTGQGALATRSNINAAFLTGTGVNNNLVEDPTYLTWGQTPSYWDTQGTGISLSTDATACAALGVQRCIRIAGNGLMNGASYDYVLSRGRRNEEIPVVGGTTLRLELEYYVEQAMNAPIELMVVATRRDGTYDYYAAGATAPGVGYGKAVSNRKLRDDHVAVRLWPAKVNWLPNQTRTGIVYFGHPKVLVASSLGSTIFRENGTTSLTDADAITSLGTAAGFTGQGPWATYASQLPSKLEGIASGATNDRIVDTRSDNQFPSWYRTNYTYRVAREFKHASIVGLAGGEYGLLETSVDWENASGGQVKQKFTYGQGLMQGQVWQRVGASDDNSWLAWQPQYSGDRKPAFDGDLLESDGGSTATLPNFKTALGTASAITGQGPGATAPANDVLNYKLENSVLSIAHPEGASFSGNSGAATGAIRIDLPQLWTNTMLRFNVEIYDYANGGSVTYQVGGYNYGGSGAGGVWHNVFAQMVGSHTRAKTVRFGSKNGKACIWIGDTDSVWTWPKVRVTNFTAGYSSYTYAAWATGWAISLDTAAASNAAPDGNGNVLTVTNPTAADAVFGQNTFETSGGAAATLANFKTGLGTAAAITGQTAWATFSAPTARLNNLSDTGNLSSISNITSRDMSLLTGRAWTNLYRANGSTPITDADAITSLGTAAAITGQGSLATRNNVQPTHFDPSLKALLLQTTNLAQYGRLAPGQAIPGGNVTAAAGAATTVVSGVGPFGETETLTRTIQPAGLSAGGGLYLSFADTDGYDHNKPYMFAVYVKRISASPSGNIYLGCSGNGDTQNFDGTTNNNPYFVPVGDSTFATGKWYLLYGILHGSGSTSGSTVSGIYDVDTGQKVSGGNEYRSTPGATSQHMRFFQYYGVQGQEHHWARPMVFPLAQAPSISQLCNKISGVEVEADVTKSASGPAEVTLNYNSDGTISSALPVNASYKLTAAGGSAYTSGVSWSVSILSGSFSGTAPSIAGSGTGVLSINSGLASTEAILSVTASYGGKSYPPVAVKVKKNTAAPPAGGGSGGSGSSSGTVSANGSYSTTTFTMVGSTVSITLPAGVTTATLTASNIELWANPVGPAGQTPSEGKWQRESSPGTWVDVGAVQAPTVQPSVIDEGGGLYTASAGSITCNRSATGLTAGSTQKFRFVMRCTGTNVKRVDTYGNLGASS